MITNIQLAEYAKKALGHPYWYGCFGQISSKSLYYSKKKQYPNQYNWECKNNQTDVLPKIQLNVQVFDCVGLIKACLWSDGVFGKKPTYKKSQDVSANGMYNACTKTGSIKDIPEVIGLLVFCEGHVGIYIGNGEVIEARGHGYGVIKTKLKDRSFTRYGYCPFDVEYIKEEIKPEKPKKKNKFFPKCDSKFYSIVDALDSLHIDFKYSYRKKIAEANGIKNFRGTVQQNIDMLNMLKAGKLKKPE